ncbi:hypothetical protein LWF01_12545 [Saxibacter everestensis]|uniref:Uncharacterized protein n=1 Tax=Saxibacter everestensis TaxID=2909229 RepID=A0ABY8QPR2_9MICO|nr:hypothetical protein LWF01_12545 [Brevibacteriaceae bacterium ZFBP1038]
MKKVTRNIVAHGAQVDYRVIWNARQRRLPDEVEQVRRILAADD